MPASSVSSSPSGPSGRADLDCPHVPELGYGDFSRRLHDRLAGRRVPLSGSIELTSRCNLACAHCYINLPASDASARERELGTEELTAVLDEIADEGCLWLLLTGGEPLLRSDFPAVWQHARRKGFLLTLFTNGTLLSPRLADLLAEWTPFCVEVTLYGATERTYERVTGVPGSYARCRQGIDLLVERGLPLKLKTVAMKLNHREIGEMKALAGSLGVSFRFDPALNPRLDGGREPTELRLTPEEVLALDLSDEARWAALREASDRLTGPPPSPGSLFACGAGMGSFHVDASGGLSLCIMAREPSYDLREGTFREGWLGPLREAREARRTRVTECTRCDLGSLCGQCPGWARIETGDAEEPVPFLCEIAHLRAERLRR